MARNLGEARVSILPDGTRLKPETEAAVKKAVEGIKGAIKLTGDDAELRARLVAIEGAIADIRGQIKFSGDTAALDAKITEVRAEVNDITGTVKMKVDAGEADAEIDALKAKTDAFSKSLNSIAPKDDNLQSFFKGILTQASDLKNSLDNVGDSDGITKASGQLDRMIASTDKVRAALGSTTFAEEQVGAAAKDAAAKSQVANQKMAADAKTAADAIMAQQSRIGKARDADDLAAERALSKRQKMYASMFDQISKSETLQAAQEAAAAKVQQAALDRIGKARDADDLTAQREIKNRQSMYASLFDQISKSEATQASLEGATARVQQAALDRISKARDADYAKQNAQILATQKMYASMFDALEKQEAKLGGANLLGSLPKETSAQQYARLVGLPTGKTFDLKVGVDGTEAEAEAVSLREKLKLALSNIKAKVTVDRDSLASTGSAILGFFSGKLSRDIAAAGEGNGKGFGDSFIAGLGRSAIMQNPGITGAVIAGLAALPAAIGVIGVVGGIALGAGIMLGATKLLKAQIKSVTTDLKQNTTALNAKGTTPDEKKSIDSVIAQDQAQLQALNKQVGAFSQVTDAVDNLKIHFIQFAVVVSKPLLKPFSDAINDLSKELDGPLAKSFTSLFKAVGPLVKPVEDSLLELVDGILPGLTDMLNQARKPLSDMILSFGKVVGLKVGQWFRDVIPYIQDSGKYLVGLIGVLGSLGSYLIKFGGETAKAFAGSQFKGFGSLIGSVGDSVMKLLIPAFEGWTSVMAPTIKALLQILTPVLQFLAANPSLVKAIAATVAIWMVWNKVILASVLITKLLTSAMKLFDVALDANAVGVIIVAIIALAAAAYIVVKNWSKIAAFFTQLWKDIWSGFVGPLINFFTETIPHAFGITLNWVKKNWPLIVGLLLVPLTGGLSLMVVAVTKYHALITKAVSVAWTHIAGVIASVLKPIQSVIDGTFKPIASVVNGVWVQITKITKVAWAVIVQIITIPARIILGLVGEAFIGIRNLTAMVWPSIYKTIKTAWGNIENAVTGTVKPIVSVVTGAWHEVESVTVAAWNIVTNISKAAWGNIENVITGVVKPLVSIVVGFWDKLSSETAAAWNGIFTTSKSSWGSIENAVTGIVKPMVTIIIALWKNLGSWTSTAFTAIYKYIIEPLDKAAVWVTNTFVHNVEGAFKGLIATVTSLWNGLKSVIATPINFVINDVWNPFANFVNTGLSVFGVKDKLPKGTPVHFASGGHVPGYAPGSDTVPAMLSPGEYVLNPTAVRAIGVRNLDSVNAAARPGGGQSQIAGGMQKFASGGDVVADAEKWNGHKYVWGGGSNPTTGWDCSSFINYIVGHDFKLNLPGGGSWATETANGTAHGPVAASYNNWNYGHAVNWANAEKGDLAIENNGGHIGMVVQDNTDHKNTALQGFAARSTATGTGYQMYYPQDFHLMRFADDRGFGEQAWDNTGGAVLKAAAEAALNGVSGIISGAMSHIPGTGPIPSLAKNVVSDVLNAAKGKLEGNQNNYQYLGSPSYGPDGVGTSAGEMSNGTQLYNYLLANLFEGNKIAAAGATASIYGESLWNPFAQGTGGRGLIGFTPPSIISDATFKGGMATQLPAIIKFVSNSGDNGAIAKMETAKTVSDAANIWMTKVERAGISDIHPQGIALATEIMQSGGVSQSSKTTPSTKKAGGGHIPGYAPGSDTVPAMLSPGEYVLNPTAAKAVGIGNLNALNAQFKPGSPQKFATGGVVSNTTILNKESQIAKEKNVIAALAAVKKPSAAQILALKNDKITLTTYDKELASYLTTNANAASAAAKAAAAKKTKAAAAAAAKKIAAGNENTLFGQLEAQYGATPYNSDPAIQSKVDQIVSEKLRIAALTATPNKSASQIATLDSEKLTASNYERQLAALVAKDKTASMSKAAATKAAAAASADQTRILNLGTHYSHTWLVNKAASVQKSMNHYAAIGDTKDYMGAAGYFNDLEAAIGRFPTQANAQHDAEVVAYDHALGEAASALKSGNNLAYVSWNQKALADAAKIKTLDVAIANPAAAPPDMTKLNPIQKLAYTLGNADAKDWTAIAYQLKNHSLDEAPVANLSHLDMTNLGLQVTPNVLDQLYAGPGAKGANWQALATALTGDLFNNSGIYNQGSGAALGILGKLTGQHGIYAGKKFSQGGWINETVIGRGLSSGMPYSFAENGPEHVSPAGTTHASGSTMTDAKLEALISAVQENTNAVKYYGAATAKGLGGVGKIIR